MSSEVRIEQLVAKYLKNKGYSAAYEGILKDIPGIQHDLENSEDLEGILLSMRGFMTETKKEETHPQFLSYPDSSTVIAKSVLPTGFVVAVAFVADNVVVATADKLVQVYSLDGQLKHKIPNLHGNAVVRAIRAFYPSQETDEQPLMVTAGMSGLVVVSDLEGNVFAEVKAHSKFVNSMDVHKNYIASSSYDKSVALLSYENKTLTKIASMILPSIPTSLCFLESADHDLRILVGRQEFSSINLYDMAFEELDTVKLWDADFGSFGNTFCPMYIAVDPENKRIAVGTDHTPYMRIILIDAASLKVIDNFTSFTPQNQYSAPQISWSSDGTGVWTISDDGVIRGVDTATGKVVTELKGHEDRIRSLHVKKDGSIVSGGADKKVILWV